MQAAIAERATWYLGFFAGWRRATERGAIDALWLGYEEMIADKPGTLRRVADFYDLPCDDAAIARGLAEAESSKGRIRFNKGVAGRGRAALTEDQKRYVIELARLHPGTDFSMIGL